MCEELSNRESFSAYDKSYINARFKEEANEHTVILNDIDKILTKDIGFDVEISKIKEVKIEDLEEIDSYVNSLDIISNLADMYDELTYYDYNFREFFYYLLDLNSVLFYWLEDVSIQNSIRGIIDVMETDEDEGF